MRQMAAVVLALLLCSCASTASKGDEADEGFVSPAAGASSATHPVAATTTDPRVSELQVLVGELLDRVEVLNARIAKLESVGPAPLPEPVSEARAASVTPPTAPAAPAPRPVTRRPLAAGTRGAELAEAYRGALELYGKGRIDDARAQFQQVLDADPDGDLADNALYWIGETWFSTGKYSQSVEVYERVVSQYGEQNKAPDAMLKIGLAQARLGDLSLARRTFETLIGRYPYSTAASAAKYELKRIKY